MTQTHKTKVLIIGSGAAGYTAAIYAARANLQPIVVQGLQPGGQLTITTEVENFPGFADPIQGPWLMEQMQKQAENVGTKLLMDTIKEVDFSSRPFKAIGESGDEYIGDSLVIATGASAKWLGMESEAKYQGFGISACATCDGFFFKDQEVVVIGGGNTAAEEALFLTNFASKVTVIHRRAEMRAEKILFDRMRKNEKIEFAWDSVVEEFVGSENPNALTHVKIKNVKTDEISELKADGAFIAIGHKPNTDLFKGKLDMDETGYLITKADSTATNIEGVYAAGDAQDHIYRQAVTAAGTGCMAALEAERFLAAN